MGGAAGAGLGGGARAAARRPLWEEDDAVRAAVDTLVEELYDRR